MEVLNLNLKLTRRSSAIYGNWEIKRDDEAGFYTCGIERYLGHSRCYTLSAA